MSMGRNEDASNTHDIEDGLGWMLRGHGDSLEIADDDDPRSDPFAPTIYVQINDTTCMTGGVTLGHYTPHWWPYPDGDPESVATSYFGLNNMPNPPYPGPAPQVAVVALSGGCISPIQLTPRNARNRAGVFGQMTTICDTNVDLSIWRIPPVQLDMSELDEFIAASLNSSFPGCIREFHFMLSTSVQNDLLITVDQDDAVIFMRLGTRPTNENHYNLTKQTAIKPDEEQQAGEGEDGGSAAAATQVEWQQARILYDSLSHGQHWFISISFDPLLRHQNNKMKNKKEDLASMSTSSTPHNINELQAEVEASTSPSASASGSTASASAAASAPARARAPSPIGPRSFRVRLSWAKSDPIAKLDSTKWKIVFGAVGGVVGLLMLIGIKLRVDAWRRAREKERAKGGKTKKNLKAGGVGGGGGGGSVGGLGERGSVGSSSSSNSGGGHAYGTGTGTGTAFGSIRSQNRRGASSVTTPFIPTTTTATSNHNTASSSNYGSNYTRLDA